MILKSKSYKTQGSGFKVQAHTTSIRLWLVPCILCLVVFSFTGCYSFRDVSPIPQEVKTFRVNYIENRARYTNPQLSPQLTDKLRQKITGQTRLSGVSTDDAHYDIYGQITNYSVSTSGISNGGANGQQQAAISRLTVTVHLNFKKHTRPLKEF